MDSRNRNTAPYSGVNANIALATGRVLPGTDQRQPDVLGIRDAATSRALQRHASDDPD